MFIACVFGTRPEAIKLCPLINRLRAQPEDFRVKVCVTAQHREMLDQTMAVFSVAADTDLDLMRPGQTLSTLTARTLMALEGVFGAERPDLVIVQGDTTTTLSAALAAFYQRIPVAHVEAGLRTGDFNQPYPEEMNRILTTRLAAWHFAPTERALAALAREGVAAERIFVTGNTGIDAVLYVRDALDRGTVMAPSWPWRDEQKRLVLVTSHRRESFGAGLARTMNAIRELAARGDVQVVYPVHRNPAVAGPVRAVLGGLPDVVLLEPLDYVSFVDLMRRSYFLVTDSGGVQEEAPSLGKPVLVLRETTERPEAVEAGTVKLVGTDEPRIVAEANRLLDDRAAYERMSRAHNPYGDGRACECIARILLNNR